MRDYAKVAPTFWTGDTGRELARRGFQGVIVGAYLMTSPHANMIGLYYQPLLYMAHETGLGLEGASLGLITCIDVGFCAFDSATEMVWVKEMASWQIAKQLKEVDLRCKGIQKEYDSLQANPFLGDFFARYSKNFHMTSARENKGLPKPLGKPLLSQEQEQEQEQEQKKELSPTAHETPKMNGHDLLGEILVTKSQKDEVAPILESYHRILPKCQRLNVLSDERRKKILKAVKLAKRLCKEKSLDYEIFWDVYFEECDRDSWLRGELANPKNANWKQNLITLLDEERFAKIMDAAFDSQESTQ